MILADLHDLAKGLQCPLRVIFLRRYMFEQMRAHLDLEREDSSAQEKDYELSSKFMLNMYTEMNRLWMRTQFDPART